MAKRIKLKGSQAHQRYYVENDGERIQVPGVTTIIGLHGGSKNILIKWANSLGLEGIDAGEYSRVAKEIGSCAHAMIEADTKGVEPDLSLFSEYAIEMAKNSYASYLNWKTQNHFIPIIQEEPLVSNNYMFGGTIDFYGTDEDGQFVLVDYKTATDVYPEHKYQVSAYARLLEENGYKVDKILIARFPKEAGSTYDSVEVPKEQVIVYFTGFLGLLSLYNCEKELRRMKRG
jgi:CRISPR/Cas system-associated exonuclease Cas4 (RecB family)